MANSQCARCPTRHTPLRIRIDWTTVNVLFAAPVLFASAGAGQERVPKRVDLVPRTEYAVGVATGEITVDGTLDDRGWDGAVAIPLNFEVWPGANTAAPVHTDCLVTYDAVNLYVGCLAHDPDPSGIRAYVTNRDDVAQHDRIVFTIDPFNDTRRGLQFGITPLGVQYDAIFDSQRRDAVGTYDPVDDSWDTIWNSAGRITADGFVVEASIPFKSLRFPRTHAPQQWGFYATRVWPRSANRGNTLHATRSGANV